MDDMGGKGSGGHNQSPENRALTESLRIAFEAEAGTVPPAAVARAKSKGIKAIRRINRDKTRRAKGGMS